MKTFYTYVEHFRPPFVLMENVLDILKKEDGAYVKYALGSLVNLGYQARVGLISAMSQGVPQGRWR